MNNILSQSLWGESNASTSDECEFKRRPNFASKKWCIIFELQNCAEFCAFFSMQISPQSSFSFSALHWKWIAYYENILHIIFEMCKHRKSVHVKAFLVLASIVPYSNIENFCKFNYFEWREWNFIAISTKYNQNKMVPPHPFHPAASAS